MKQFVKTIFFGLFVFIVSCKQSSAQSITISNIDNPSHPSGTANYLLSNTFHEMTMHDYIFYSDSNAVIGYAQINGKKEKMTVWHIFDDSIIYGNSNYRVIIYMSKPSKHTKTQVESLGDWDDWAYMALEGKIKIADMHGKQITKSFIGGKLYVVKK